MNAFPAADQPFICVICGHPIEDFENEQVTPAGMAHQGCQAERDTEAYRVGIEDRAEARRKGED